MSNKRLENFRKGYQSAFEFYQDKFEEKLYHFLRYLSGDEWIAQEGVSYAFIRLFEKRERITDEPHMERFLYRVARNYFYKQMRRERVVSRAEVELALLLGDRTTADDPEVDLNEILMQVMKAKDGLPPQRKKVVELFFFEGLTTREIALRMTIAEQTVRNTLNDSLKSLRAEIRLRL